MYTFVGLGNPGDTYEETRHNVGRRALLSVMERRGVGNAVFSNKYAGLTREACVEGEEVTFLFPETYMNKSGSSVKKVVKKEDAPEKLVVVYDDIDLPVGEVKVSFGKGAGGHNGVSNIIEALGTKEFTRVRIGIAPVSFFLGRMRRPPSGAPLTRHVLGPFKKREVAMLPEVYEKVDRALTAVLKGGPQHAMNVCN